MGPCLEIKQHEFEALRQVVISASDFCDAIRDSCDVEFAGSDCELTFIELERALSHLPEHFEKGKYLWRELEEDWQADALGG